MEPVLSTGCLVQSKVSLLFLSGFLLHYLGMCLGINIKTMSHMSHAYTTFKHHLFLGSKSA